MAQWFRPLTDILGACDWRWWFESGVVFWLVLLREIDEFDSFQFLVVRESGLVEDNDESPNFGGSESFGAGTHCFYPPVFPIWEDECEGIEYWYTIKGFFMTIFYSSNFWDSREEGRRLDWGQGIFSTEFWYSSQLNRLYFISITLSIELHAPCTFWATKARVDSDYRLSLELLKSMYTRTAFPSRGRKSKMGNPLWFFGDSSEFWENWFTNPYSKLKPKILFTQRTY